MPDSINIGGIGLRLTAFQERAREYRGESVRAFDQSLLSGRDLPARTWDGTSDWITPAEEVALRAVIEAGNVVCTSTSPLVLYGESVLCEVTIEAVPRGPDVQSGNTVYSTVNVTLALVLREVAP